MSLNTTHGQRKRGARWLTTKWASAALMFWRHKRRLGVVALEHHTDVSPATESDPAWDDVPPWLCVVLCKLVHCQPASSRAPGVSVEVDLLGPDGFDSPAFGGQMSNVTRFPPAYPPSSPPCHSQWICRTQSCHRYQACHTSYTPAICAPAEEYKEGRSTAGVRAESLLSPHREVHCPSRSREFPPIFFFSVCRFPK
ncbi:unnamed protein product [Pleuronectes platessa]|uniref:Uncharacterized protein n=1 Tax=Pleuronectes platessa TaxID=8262 RepID=A0A9N7Z7Z5_PLEPL|nr:unnamed protein product [Pleuronectes platessa]